MNNNTNSRLLRTAYILSIVTITYNLLEGVVSNSWALYPNPTDNYATLEFDNANNTYSLTMTNIQGQIIRTIDKITTGKVRIDKDDLSTGMYFFQLRTDRQVAATGKLI